MPTRRPPVAIRSFALVLAASASLLIACEEEARHREPSPAPRAGEAKNSATPTSPATAGAKDAKSQPAKPAAKDAAPAIAPLAAWKEVPDAEKVAEKGVLFAIDVTDAGKLGQMHEPLEASIPWIQQVCPKIQPCSVTAIQAKPGVPRSASLVDGTSPEGNSARWHTLVSPILADKQAKSYTPVGEIVRAWLDGKVGEQRVLVLWFDGVVDDPDGQHDIVPKELVSQIGGAWTMAGLLKYGNKNAKQPIVWLTVLAQKDAVQYGRAVVKQLQLQQCAVKDDHCIVLDAGPIELAPGAARQLQVAWEPIAPKPLETAAPTAPAPTPPKVADRKFAARSWKNIGSGELASDKGSAQGPVSLAACPPHDGLPLPNLGPIDSAAGWASLTGALSLKLQLSGALPAAVADGETSWSVTPWQTTGKTEDAIPWWKVDPQHVPPVYQTAPLLGNCEKSGTLRETKLTCSAQDFRPCMAAGTVPSRAQRVTEYCKDQTGGALDSLLKRPALAAASAVSSNPRLWLASLEHFPVVNQGPLGSPLQATVWFNRKATVDSACPREFARTGGRGGADVLQRQIGEMSEACKSELTEFVKQVADSDLGKRMGKDMFSFSEMDEKGKRKSLKLPRLYLGVNALMRLAYGLADQVLPAKTEAVRLTWLPHIAAGNAPPAQIAASKCP